MAHERVRHVGSAVSPRPLPVYREYRGDTSAKYPIVSCVTGWAVHRGAALYPSNWALVYIR